MPLLMTAGPTPDTITDFWQMVLDVRPAVIVMLTKLNENGKVREVEMYIKLLWNLFRDGRT